MAEEPLAVADDAAGRAGGRMLFLRVGAAVAGRGIPAIRVWSLEGSSGDRGRRSPTLRVQRFVVVESNAVTTTRQCSI